MGMGWNGAMPPLNHWVLRLDTASFSHAVLMHLIRGNRGEVGTTSSEIEPSSY